MEAAPSTCQGNLASSEYLIHVRRSLPFIAIYVANVVVHHACPGCSIETRASHIPVPILFSLFSISFLLPFTVLSICARARLDARNSPPLYSSRFRFSRLSPAFLSIRSSSSRLPFSYPHAEKRIPANGIMAYDCWPFLRD